MSDTVTAVVKRELVTPQPGDVVRLDGHYDVLVNEGDKAVIDGVHFGEEWEDGKGPRVLIVFRASAFRGPSSKYSPNQHIYVSCSGGPAPLVPMSELVHVGVIEQRFWRWKDLPRAHGGVDYTRIVNLWSWGGRHREQA